MEKSLSISKLDAAKRQLETVIRLYFSNGDPVAIHTLTAAAYNIIRDVTKRRGVDPMLVKDKLFEYVKPEYQKEFRDKLNEAENFFKHADRDHDKALEFNPVQSEFLISDAISQYYKLTGEDPPLFKIYRMWFIANDPRMFTFPEEQKRILESIGDNIVKMGREAFFNTALPLVMRLGV